MIRVKLEHTPEEYKQEALELWRASGHSAAKVEAEPCSLLTTTERRRIFSIVPLNFLSLIAKESA